MNPKWSDEIQFHRDELQRDTIVVACESYDENGDNNLIGTGYVSFTSILIPNKRCEKTIDLFFEGKEAGNIQIELEFITDEP